MKMKISSTSSGRSHVHAWAWLLCLGLIRTCESGSRSLVVPYTDADLIKAEHHLLSSPVSKTWDASFKLDNRHQFVTLYHGHPYRRVACSPLLAQDAQDPWWNHKFHNSVGWWAPVLRGIRYAVKYVPELTNKNLTIALWIWDFTACKAPRRHDSAGTCLVPLFTAGSYDPADPCLFALPNSYFMDWYPPLHYDFHHLRHMNLSVTPFATIHKYSMKQVYAGGRAPPARGPFIEWTSKKPVLFWRGRNHGFTHKERDVETYGPALFSEILKLLDDPVTNRSVHPVWNVRPRWKIALQAKEASYSWLDAKILVDPATGRRDEDVEVKELKSRGYLSSQFARRNEKMQYKYLIDLGGMGGTTWQGCLTILSMNSVLFHHETGIHDWFYGHMQPWVHYVPVKADLSDLHDKYLWAEAHQAEAYQIAINGNKLASTLTLEAQARDVIAPLLRMAHEAYSAPATPHPHIIELFDPRPACSARTPQPIQ